ncbi:MAG: peptidoglycan D,D-transpeptidase FtsI family protein [Actinomycetota bacterium]
MNRSIRKVALALAVALIALLVQLNYDQVIAARRFSDNPNNRRLLDKEYSTQRGDIIADGQLLAHSERTNDRLKYIRVYPFKDLTAELTGYYSIVFGASALEHHYNDFLSGERPFKASNIVDDLLGRDRKGNSIQLTLDLKLQQLAKQKLGSQRGAVVALNPNTGEILAMYSNPSYDPSGLSSHDLGVINRTWSALGKDPLTPLVARSYQQLYPPGSTFKVVVSAAALEAGVKPSDTFPNPTALPLPLTNIQLRNDYKGACPGASEISFADGLRVSCNTTFAQIGMRIGPQKLVSMAEKFGLDNPSQFDLGGVTSCVRAATIGCDTPTLDKPQTALSSIGQFGVRVSPLQMAVVAATIANDGRVPVPHIVREVQDYAGHVIQTYDPAPSAPIYSMQTAQTLKSMMIDVVNNGTGQPAAVRGVVMGGKTGTAQTGIPGQAPHVWFIAFAPGIAVAVVVENGGLLGVNATGGRVAGPIAQALIQEIENRGKTG